MTVNKFDPTSIDPTNAREVLSQVLRSAMSDDCWQDFGYPKRPRTGALFQFFRPRWKTELEDKIMREILICFVATYKYAGRLDKDEVYLVNCGLAQLWQTLGYAHNVEALDDFSASVDYYTSQHIEKWASIMVTRIEPLAIPDKKHGLRVMAGCSDFTENLGRMVTLLSNKS